MTDKFVFNDSELDELDRKLFNRLSAAADPDISERLHTIRKNLDTSITIVARPSSSSRYKLWGASAAIAAAAIIAVVRLFGLGSTPVTQSYTTVKGQRASITLADGSHVILAPATRLRVTGRAVDISGEAIFTVKKQTGDPFTVRAGNNVTTVLGTTFGVRAYDETVQVVVADGKVSNGSAVLSAGDVAVITKNDIQIQRNADVASLISWSRGTLAFTGAPLSEVLTTLSRWYNLEFVASDPELLNRRVTAAIGANAVPNEMLDLITASLNMRYARVGQTVTLYPEKQ